jgi:hypothetical protein
MPYREVETFSLASQRLDFAQNALLSVSFATRTILSLTNEETTSLKLLLAKSLDSTTSILVCHVGKAEPA